MRVEKGMAKAWESASQYFDNRVLRWRLLGAFACCIIAIWGLMFSICLLKGIVSFIVPFLRVGIGLQSWSWWLMVGVLQASMGLETLAYAFSLQIHDHIVTFNSYEQYMPQIVAATLMKLGGRLSTVEGCLVQACCLMLRYISGVVGLEVISGILFGTRLGGLHVSVLGFFCTVLYHTHLIFWSRDVIVFPSEIKHRWYRWRDGCDGVVQRGIPVGVVAAVGHSLGCRVVLGAPGAIGIYSSFLNILLATLLIVLWSLGDLIVDVVLTERFRVRDYDSKDAMTALQDCLNGNKGDMMRMISLYDLSLIPSDEEKVAWRRRDIFADDSGVSWKRLASLCSDILGGMISEIEKVHEVSKNTVKDRHGAKWNTIPTGNIKPSAVMNEAMHCLLQLAGYHQSLVLSVRFLSDMAYVSVKEDTYGILQLSEPRLGDIVYWIARLNLELKHLGQWIAAGRHGTRSLRWRASGEEIYSYRRVDSVLDVVKMELAISLENLGHQFGDLVINAVESSDMFATCGSDIKQNIRLSVQSYINHT
ncbi:hypothetical protein PSENEW3n2_00002221 [Picochlorum sp. SENEW3]|nr:hypothetical protein PSENEW3n2_00002221 [Picochlorum sp. SENEW3]WPT15858.1 hypothetical protein PSENEW3_00002221 [Picochlorum sp. SENEW3]